MKLSIVIPVYNEKGTIREIIELVKNVNLDNLKVLGKEIEKEIIVVDDASNDGTVEILRLLEKENPQIKFFFKDINKGKGHTLKIGFSKTTGDYVIVQDADLEYDPNDYIKLLRVLDESKVDVIYGSRFSGSYKDMTNLHYFGNKILTLFTNIFFKVMLTDMETCYKLIPGDFIRKVNIKSERFDFEPEITAKILKSGLRIMEVPITYKGRSFSEGKKISWKDGFGAFKALIWYRFFD